jgi:Tol biopolymer transport system component
MAGVRIGGMAPAPTFGIPYTRTVGANQGIWTVDDTGGNPQLVSIADSDGRINPVRSPNKQSIVFLKFNTGTFEYNIWMLTSSSEGAIDTGYSRYPNWSPDGSTIVFTSYDSGDEKKVFTMNPDGTGRTAIYTSSSGSAILSRAVYNSDGTLIAFQDEDAGEIWVMNADGSGATMIDDGSTDSPSGLVLTQDNAISWANGSNRLTYGNGRGSGNGKWIAIDSDGTNRDIIATEPSTDAQGQRQAWDADDSLTLAYTFSLGNGYALLACDPNGSGSALLSPTVYAYTSGLPMLVFNGRIYFVRKPVGTPYLASVLFDGSDLRDEDTSDGTKIHLEVFD